MQGFANPASLVTIHFYYFYNLNYSNEKYFLKSKKRFQMVYLPLCIVPYIYLIYSVWNLG